MDRPVTTPVGRLLDRWSARVTLARPGSPPQLPATKENMKSLLMALTLLLCCALMGCGSAQTKASTEPAAAPAASAAPAAVPATAPAPAAGEVRCPVSGEGFVPSATSPTSEYNGKTYTFCCPGCKKKFDADPAKFAANPASAKASDAKPCGDCATGKPCADCTDKDGAKKAETK